MYTLRPDQLLFNNSIETMWRLGNRNVVGVAPTGFGKTVTASHIITDTVRRLVKQTAQRGQYVIIIAHRQELIEQWGLALAKAGVAHTFIAQPATINSACNRQREELGHCLRDPNSRVYIAAVDTLVNRNLGKLRDLIGLWVCDEGHHCIASNKWGRSVLQFPNALGLGLTATPERADGKGIGRHASGVFDALVTGPSLRECIELGGLTDYDVLAPPSDLDMSSVPVSDTTGDWVQGKLSTVLDASSVYGDVVGHYLTHARGKKAVTFAQDIAACVRLANEFKMRGVPAVALSAHNTSKERSQAKNALRDGGLWQIVNCDLFSEGFDLPAVEIMQDVQPTRSYARFAQKFGRALRVMPGNPEKRALILDHVGNVAGPDGHGLPDHRKSWSMNDVPKRARNMSAEVGVRTCGQPGCFHVFAKELPACPYCGWRPTMQSSARELAQIEGSLVLLSGDQLASLRREIERIDRTPEEFRSDLLHGGMSDRASYGAASQHRKRSEAQLTLRHQLLMWAGLMRHLGCGEIEQELLVARFGVNVLKAQTFGRPDAEALTQRLRDDITAHIGAPTYRQDATA